MEHFTLFVFLLFSFVCTLKIFNFFGGTYLKPVSKTIYILDFFSCLFIVLWAAFLLFKN